MLGPYILSEKFREYDTHPFIYSFFAALVSDHTRLMSAPTGHIILARRAYSMKVTQISVFIANRPGELAKLTSHLAQFNINMKAISVAEAMDYGIVRMITNDPDKAGAALSDRGYGFVRNEVVVVEIPDRPGALAELCRKLADAGMDIRYLYSTVTPGGGVASAVLSTDDNDRADTLIKG
jgi:hypothetical protein